MDKLTHFWRRLSAHPFLTVTVVLTLYTLFYLKGVEVEYALFGDMMGKWVQVLDVLHKPVGDFSCFYKESFDPAYKYIPGPGYFYAIQGDKCLYFYPYTYAYAVAPFVKISLHYGFYLFNFIFSLLYVFCVILLTRIALPEKQYAALPAGLAAFLILPTGVYSFDFSEMSISIFFAAASLLFGAIVLKINVNTAKTGQVERKISANRISLYLFLSGLAGGILFSFRSEGAVFSAFLIAAVFLDPFIYLDSSTGQQERDKKFLPTIGARIKFSLVTSWAIIPGFLAGLGISFLFHWFFFDNILGIRGAFAADLAKGISLNEQLKVAYTLLFGGSLGLFTSLPFILLGLFLFVPGIGKPEARTAIFFSVIALGTTLATLAVAPFDGGYSWSPRYLAFALPAFLILTLLVIYSDHKLFQNIITKVLLAILLLYSLNFTHRGMKVIQQASRQNKTQNLLIDKLAHDTDVIVLDHWYLYGMLSKTNLKKRVFQAHSPEMFANLLKKFDENNISRFVFLAFPPALHHNSPVKGDNLPVGWRKEAGKQEGTIFFTRIYK